MAIHINDSYKQLPSVIFIPRNRIRFIQTPATIITNPEEEDSLWGTTINNEIYRAIIELNLDYYDILDLNYDVLNLLCGFSEIPLGIDIFNQPYSSPFFLQSSNVAGTAKLTEVDSNDIPVYSTSYEVYYDFESDETHVCVIPFTGEIESEFEGPLVEGEFIYYDYTNKKLSMFSNGLEKPIGMHYLNKIIGCVYLFSKNYIEALPFTEELVGTVNQNRPMKFLYFDLNAPENNVGTDFYQYMGYSGEHIIQFTTPLIEPPMVFPSSSDINVKSIMIKDVSTSEVRLELYDILGNYVGNPTDLQLLIIGAY